VSHWNGYPDFVRFAQEGIRFVISKASQGLSMQDETFERHTREARAAGMMVGGYHFFDYRRDGRAQARHFLATLRATTGLDGLLPLVVDVETLSTLGTPDRTRARQRLHDLLDELYRQTGRYPMVYTSRYMWKQVVGEPLGFGDYPLWVACWKCDEVHLPRGWSAWRFWQIGQFRFGNGLPRLDGNLYSAGLGRLRGERQRAMRLDNGATWAADPLVRADLRGFDGEAVRIALEGGDWGAWQAWSSQFEVALGKRQGARDVRVQLRSFRGVRSPVLSDGILLDSIAPGVTGPRIGIEEGVRLSRHAAQVPVIASMEASDATSGVDRAVLSASCGGVQRARSAGVASSRAIEVDLDREGCTVSAKATDQLGHSTTRSLGPSVALVDVRRRDPGIRFAGRWSTVRRSDALGGTLTRSSTGGASATFQVEGAQFAVVADRTPSSGRLDVIVDGKLAERISLYSRMNDARRVVYVGSMPRGRHTVRLRVVGSREAASSGTWVRLDGLLVLDRRR
jgi:lysozyme